MARLIASCESAPAAPRLTARADSQGQSPFRVTTRRDGATAVVRVEGDIDLGSAGLLQRSLVTVVDSGAQCLVLDLGSVSFLDCSGIRVLLGARDLARARGGWLRLEQVPAGVRRILQLTRTQELLDVIQESDATPGLHLA